HHAVENYFGIAKHEKSAEYQPINLVAPAYAATEGADGDHSEDKVELAPGEPDPKLGQGAIYMAPSNHVLDDAHHVPNWVIWSPFIAMLLGFLGAYHMYIRRPELPGILAEQQRPLYNFLLNKWYFDELYDFIFVRPARWIGNFLWKKGDGATIDGGINGLAMGVVPFFTRAVNRAQSGYLFHYAFAMVIGIALLITWMTLGA
ncbi:MAG: NADH-quinone oxidoreductase subunit L, partial [Pseudomonadota bacterium]